MIEKMEEPAKIQFETPEEIDWLDFQFSFKVNK